MTPVGILKQSSWRCKLAAKHSSLPRLRQPLPPPLRVGAKPLVSPPLGSSSCLRHCRGLPHLWFGAKQAGFGAGSTCRLGFAARGRVPGVPPCTQISGRSHPYLGALGAQEVTRDALEWIQQQIKQDKAPLSFPCLRACCWPSPRTVSAHLREGWEGFI